MPAADGPQTTGAIILNFSVIAIETERYKMYFLWIIAGTFTFDIWRGKARIPGAILLGADVFGQRPISIRWNGLPFIWFGKLRLEYNIKRFDEKDTVTILALAV